MGCGDPPGALRADKKPRTEGRHTESPRRRPFGNLSTAADEHVSENQGWRLPFGADSELLSPAGAAAREHRTPILGLHAAAESMRLRPVAVVWLKSTLRHSSSIT